MVQCVWLPTYMDKNTLRSTIRALRNNLSTEERIAKSRAISKKLESHPRFKAAQIILFYVSTPEEVDTHELIQTHLNKKTILVPTVHGNHLKCYELTKWNQLKKGTYGILEIPSTLHSPFTQPPELIIVPGIAFDTKGHRVGYGKGYYDNTLSRHSAPTIGLAYQLQVVDHIPQEPHDQAVDILITETETYSAS